MRFVSVSGQCPTGTNSKPVDKATASQNLGQIRSHRNWNSTLKADWESIGPATLVHQKAIERSTCAILEFLGTEHLCTTHLGGLAGHFPPLEFHKIFLNLYGGRRIEAICDLRKVFVDPIVGYAIPFKIPTGGL